jgi:hypothetical protein
VKAAYQKVGLAIMVGIVLLIAVAMLYVVDFNRAGIAGALIGALVGLLNLAVGYVLAERGLKRSMNAVFAILLGGFFARLLILVALVFLFHKTEAVNEVAFALVFMIFFFLYVGAEIVLVNRAARSPGSHA